MEQIMPDYSVLIQAGIFLVALYVIKSFILTPISEVLRGRSERIEGSARKCLPQGIGAGGCEWQDGERQPPPHDGRSSRHQ